MNTNGKLAAVKGYIKDHRKEIIIGGVCLTVGALAGGTFVATTNGMVTNQKITNLIAWKPFSANISQQIKALGHPGFEVMDTETGIHYPSINNAAKETGVNVSSLARQLHGEQPHVDGKVFKIVGLAKPDFPVPAAA